MLICQDYPLQYKGSFALLYEHTKSTLFPKILMPGDYHSFSILSVSISCVRYVCHLDMDTDNFNVREQCLRNS